LQYAKKGQILFRINEQSFIQRIKLAQAQLKQAKTQYLVLSNRLTVSLHLLDKQLAKQNVLCRESLRYQILLKQSAVSKEKANQVLLNCQIAMQDALSTKQNVNTIRQIIGKNIKNYAPYQQAQAKLNIAKLNDKYTFVVAPSNGYITALTLQRGDYVKAGQGLFSLISESLWWVTAKVKEGDLFGIKPGATVCIRFPSIPHRTFKGVVYGIGWGVNRRDASPTVRQSPLPYIPKEMNWIQLDQRFPVRINIIRPKKSTPFRVGATAHVLITRND